jgi:hypothetical protein
VVFQRAGVHQPQTEARSEPVHQPQTEVINPLSVINPPRSTEFQPSTLIQQRLCDPRRPSSSPDPITEPFIEPPMAPQPQRIINRPPNPPLRRQDERDMSGGDTRGGTRDSVVSGPEPRQMVSPEQTLVVSDSPPVIGGYQASPVVQDTSAPLPASLPETGGSV